MYLTQQEEPPPVGSSATASPPSEAGATTSTTTSTTSTSDYPPATGASFAPQPQFPTPAMAAGPSGSTAGGANTNGSSTTIPDSKTTEASVTKKKKKNSRRKHRNSHLGCGTCKKRRIKCDETLPACLNCLKGKLNCAYLNLDSTARNALRMAQFNQSLRQDKVDDADPQGQPSSTTNSPPSQAASVAAQALPQAYLPLNTHQQPPQGYPLLPATTVIQSPYGSLVSLQPVIASDGSVVYAATAAPQPQLVQNQQMSLQRQQAANVHAANAAANAHAAQVAHAQAAQVAHAQAAQMPPSQLAPSQLISPPMPLAMGASILPPSIATTSSASSSTGVVPLLTPITSSPSTAAAAAAAAPPPPPSISALSPSATAPVSRMAKVPPPSTSAPSSGASSVSPPTTTRNPLSIPITTSAVNNPSFVKKDSEVVLPPLLSTPATSSELRVPALNKSSRVHTSYTDLTKEAVSHLKTSSSSSSLSTAPLPNAASKQIGSPLLAAAGDHISTFHSLSLSDNEVKLPSISSLPKPEPSQDKVPSISKLLS
ncbi:uncharacterized protein CANTADRAFT_7247 [Suhomyces tanzawaensis NRRL Y-17324]|uniref:Zn(2)-C6 fungal-type domain-containing protein n=1 Tax=Suhomyces tanzawaensis NRRL Y-17324 TaxID=984487 RepID=A0A1E4SE47_9ASCO|nr:uncharacterized protein CANTADRAFT_7247 [Suhomyces tanzawaensis NRRL Y-17324]ODV77750.1 hypothetical protein CANTADRAFT_7247 [Suhomyces tanzawaensis NRRL Y-17324]